MNESEISWPGIHVNAILMAKEALERYDKAPGKGLLLPFCLTIQAEALGAQVTLSTETYEPRITSYAISSVTERSLLTGANIGEGRARTVFDAIRIIKTKHPSIPVTCLMTGPVSTAGSIMDPVSLLRDLRKRPAEAHELISFITEECTKFALSCAGAGADALLISEACGSESFIGPGSYSEFTEKYLGRLTSDIKRAYPKVQIRCSFR